MGIKKKLRKIFKKRGIEFPYILMTGEEKYLHKVVNSVGSNNVVIDLGAHVGKISKMFAKRAKTVYAFEPNPETFKVLKERVAAYPNIVAMQKAVSDRDGTATLYFDPSGSDRPTEGSTLAEAKRDVTYRNSFEVETFSLPRFIESLEDDVKLIKIDIEGLEYRVVNDLIDSGVMARVGMVYVEDHCFVVEGLEAERDATLEKIRKLGLEDRFRFDWP